MGESLLPITLITLVVLTIRRESNGISSQKFWFWHTAEPHACQMSTAKAVVGI
jgi:hypothetical protein